MPDTIQLKVEVLGAAQAAQSLRSVGSEAANTQRRSISASRLEQIAAKRMSDEASAAERTSSRRAAASTSLMSRIQARALPQTKFDIRDTVEYAEAQQRLSLTSGRLSNSLRGLSSAASGSSDSMRRVASLASRALGFGELGERALSITSAMGNLGKSLLKVGLVGAAAFGGWKLGTVLMDITGLRKKVDELTGAMDELPEYNKAARRVSSYEAARAKYESENPTMAGFDEFWKKNEAKKDWRERGTKVQSAADEYRLSRLAKGDYSQPEGASAKDIVETRISQGLVKLPDDVKKAGTVYANLIRAEQQHLDEVTELLQEQRTRTPGTAAFRKAMRERTSALFTASETGRQAAQGKAELDATVGKGILDEDKRARAAVDYKAKRLAETRADTGRLAGAGPDPEVAAQKAKLQAEAITLQAERSRLDTQRRREPDRTADTRIGKIDQRLDAIGRALVDSTERQQAMAQGQRARLVGAAGDVAQNELSADDAAAAERFAAARKAAYEAWREKELEVIAYENDNIEITSTSEEALQIVRQKAAQDRARNRKEQLRAEMEAERQWAIDQRAVAEARRRAANAAAGNRLRVAEGGARGQLAVLDRARGVATDKAARAAAEVARREERIRDMGVAAGNERLNFGLLARANADGRKARRDRRQLLEDKNDIQDLTDRLAAGERIPKTRRNRELLKQIRKEQEGIKAADAQKAAAEKAMIALDLKAAQLQTTIESIIQKLDILGMAP